MRKTRSKVDFGFKFVYCKNALIHIGYIQIYFYDSDINIIGQTIYIYMLLYILPEGYAMIGIH